MWRGLRIKATSPVTPRRTAFPLQVFVSARLRAQLADPYDSRSLPYARIRGRHQLALSRRRAAKRDRAMRNRRPMRRRRRRRAIRNPSRRVSVFSFLLSFFFFFLLLLLLLFAAATRRRWLIRKLRASFILTNASSLINRICRMALFGKRAWKPDAGNEVRRLFIPPLSCSLR